jgi:hypothetical protein
MPLAIIPGLGEGIVVREQHGRVYSVSVTVAIQADYAYLGGWLGLP